VVPEGFRNFTVAKDGMSILWQCVTKKICFASKHLKAVMRGDYFTSHNCVITYNNVVQKMMGDKKVASDAVGQFLGMSQFCLKARVRGIPKELFLPYPARHTT
jgi:hypothetical protein